MRRSYPSALILLLSSLSLAVALPSGAGEDRLPRLDPPGSLEDLHSYRATGTDPSGPRPLVLWRWDGTRFIKLASTRSDTNGQFDFGEQALPSNEVYFHVSVRNEGASTDHLLRIERPVPAPVVVAGGLGSGEIIFAPAHPGGEVRIYNADTGRLILRKPVEARTRFRVSLDLLAELPQPWPSALAIEQVLDNGRRSERQHWPLDRPERLDID